MKRLLPLLVGCLACAASAQTTAPTAQSNEPDTPPAQNVEVRGDGRCTTVRSGDTVHYTLTIEGVGGAHAVYGDLRLRLGRFHEPMSGGLPVPDFRSLGGGGLGTRDAAEAKMYRFAFKVPQELFGGTYRGFEVNVHADQPQTRPQPSPYLRVERPEPRVEVTRHTRDEVRRYCLNVMSHFGIETRYRAAVTNFEPGPVDPSPASLTPAPLAPLQPLPPRQPGPPPQPR